MQWRCLSAIKDKFNLSSKRLYTSNAHNQGYNLKLLINHLVFFPILNLQLD